MSDRYLDETTDMDFVDDDQWEEAAPKAAYTEEVPRQRIREGMPANVTDSELILRRVIDLIATAGTVPLSSSPRINREEVMELLEEAVARLPNEIRESRHLLKERNEFIARHRREADEILDAARNQAERMVQRQEIVRAAEAKARHLLEETEADCRRRMRETEDWCDRRLASFQIVLDKVSRTVAIGRERLNALNDKPGESDAPVELAEDTQARTRDDAPAVKAFFDQDDE
jgi:hypothetical protein